MKRQDLRMVGAFKFTLITSARLRSLVVGCHPERFVNPGRHFLDRETASAFVVAP